MNQADFNMACMGYCLNAMRNAGLDDEQIRKVMGEFWQTFDDYDTEDAIRIYKDYKN